MALPQFKYHPDPLATGSVVPSDDVCVCCGQARGFIYEGPSYGDDAEPVCPWCIAEGSVHDKFDVEFVDLAGIGGYGKWESVPDKVMEEIAHRTPSFNSWQQEQWFTHCGDAASFLGPMGRAELAAYGADALAALRDSLLQDQMPEADADDMLRELDRNYGPTGYLFRCLHCGKYGGYVDFV